MKKNNIGFYVGLMSGTSCDGIDASLVKTDGNEIFEPISNIHLPYSNDFKRSLLKLMQEGGDFLNLETTLSNLHANAVLLLLQDSNINPQDVVAIGFHGQTISHQPKESVCWQIGNPHILKNQTTIDVVYDFRRKDIALGGQGAPLMPIFHKCIAGNLTEPVAIINIGGVANITYISQHELIAFDTGPGNALIDDAMQQYFQQKFDEDGKVANLGKVNHAKIKGFMQDNYFDQNYPKSLDRNHFYHFLTNLSLLNKEDIISTLTYFTAKTIHVGLNTLPNMPQKIYLCGGGAKNRTLIYYLQDLCQGKIGIYNISKINKNLDVDFIESQGFAYLAARYMNKLPSSFPTTTGVKNPLVCGVLVS